MDNAGNIGSVSSEKSAATAGTTTSSGNVYDDFQDGTYKLQMAKSHQTGNGYLNGMLEVSGSKN